MRQTGLIGTDINAATKTNAAGRRQRDRRCATATLSRESEARLQAVVELGRYTRELSQRIACRIGFKQTPLSFHFGRDIVIAAFP